MADYSIPRVECRIYLDEAGKLYSETPITSADDAVQLLASEMKGLDRESLYVLNLDTKSRVINLHQVSLGVANMTVATTGNILKTALLSGAFSILVMHNHPSGVPEPSPEDIAVTEKIRKAAELMEIQFLDHIVVGRDGAWSIVHNAPVPYRDPHSLVSEPKPAYRTVEAQEGKYIRAFRIYEQAMQRLTAGPENWMAFLATASYLAMHPAEYQVMAFAQKPDATACATYSQWQRMGCVPRQGSHGICVPVLEKRQKGTGKKLEYLFDISDVAVKKGGQLPSLMKVAEEDLPFLESFLREEAGSLHPSRETGSSIADAAWGMAGKAIAGDMGSYLEEIQDSLLEAGLSLDFGGQQELEQFLCASLSYMLLYRINRREAAGCFAPEDFAYAAGLQGIRRAEAVLSILQKSAAPVFHAVKRYVEKELPREKEKRRQEELDREKRSAYNPINTKSINAINTIEGGARDDDSSRKPEPGGRDGISVRGRDQDGPGEPGLARGRDRVQGRDPVRPGGGILLPGHPDGSGTGTGILRNEEAGMDEGARQHPLHLVPDGGQTVPDLQAGGAGGGGTGRDTPETVPGELPGPGYGQRPRGLGRLHGDGGAGSPADGAGRSDLQGRIGEERKEGGRESGSYEQLELSALFLQTDEDRIPEQIIQTEGAAVEGIPPMAAPSSVDDVLEAAVYYGPGMQNGKLRIAALYSREADAGKRIAGLKAEYGTGGGSLGFRDGSRGFIDYSPKGIRIWHYGTGTERLIHWPVVEKLIGEMLRNGRYLSGEEKRQFEAMQEEPDNSKPTGETEKPGRGAETPGRETERPGREVETPGRKNGGETVRKESPAERYPESGKNGTSEAATQASGSLPARNYRLTDNAIGNATPKGKYQHNIAAIRLLKQIEQEGRYASMEEQDIFARYVGWGGLPQAFDLEREGWKAEAAALKELLTPEEYRAARASTLSAFYTQPAVIRAMYQALSGMGFTEGRILEPSMGIGNFFGTMPEEMRGSSLTGVELDSISGRIAKLLYPEADIRVQGFETLRFPENSFDVVVGNIPFGDFRLADPDFDRHHFLVHDYFLAKSLSVLRPGGVAALITSRGTMDKADPSVRRYLAQRADLLGAIRLPNNAFKANAGTEVTADILFLQKREDPVLTEPEWIYVEENGAGILINRYYISHPDMVLGQMAMVSGRHGEEPACLPVPGELLEIRLQEAAGNIHGEMWDMENVPEIPSRPELAWDLEARPFSYLQRDGKLYFLDGEGMREADVSAVTAERILAMIPLREAVRELIQAQKDGAPDGEIIRLQANLNERYDLFTEKYGVIGNAQNRRAFGDDSSYYLMASLEHLDGEGNLLRKADIFTKRTIQAAVIPDHVETAAEALIVSISEKGKVDLPYMSTLTGQQEEEIIHALEGVIFKNPENGNYENADEYLSGNIRNKLAAAKEAAREDHEYDVNITKLEEVMPEPLGPAEITVRLGATWIKPEIYQDFLLETLNPPRYLRWKYFQVQYEPETGAWRITGKSKESMNPYCTTRITACELIEQALNLKTPRIFDCWREVDGSTVRRLNREETVLAEKKQDMLKEAFKDWIFKDPVRRQEICDTYNKLFNSVRLREFDGSHLAFPGMNPAITLRPHQKDAVARQLFGGNTLLAHCVGAGKTFEMAAACMESIRLGLSRKGLFVVPNHLTEQWASDFCRLYPGAKVLAATKKDFAPAFRKTFCARIATGDYDAVIIGHSQFEKIPLSSERQARYLSERIDELRDAIEAAERHDWRGENRFSIKQMEKSMQGLRTKLERLQAKKEKDNVVTFEELGVDHLYVDESHLFKNLALYTKMSRVAGIPTTGSAKAEDMYIKCRYLDEITGGKGITFATGTPVSNSVAEFFTIQRYLQAGLMSDTGFRHFDAWASTFGDTVTAMELAPEGSGYRTKTRFARFINVPELMTMFRQSADIRTAEMLQLDVPEAEYETVALEASPMQKEILQGLAERAENIRAGQVDASVDNMLAITTDGKKMALDIRVFNSLLPEDGSGKTEACVTRAFSIWEETKKAGSTQLIFCDLSTPQKAGGFSVYQDIKDKLMARGIPEGEIAFIHDADTEVKKDELFRKVRTGQVRILIGSTAKMGAGTNCQDKCIALHHLDAPWRPADIEQREGRIIRFGNENKKVKIFRYVTQGTFDGYLWQVLEAKQRFISQVMSGGSTARTCEDIDDAVLNYAEVKACCADNPLLKERMELDVDVSKLRILKSAFKKEHYRLQDLVGKTYPHQIADCRERITRLTDDAAYLSGHPVPGTGGEGSDEISMEVLGSTYNTKKDAGAALLEAVKQKARGIDEVLVGRISGFELSAYISPDGKKHVLTIRRKSAVRIDIPSVGGVAVNRILQSLEELPSRLWYEEDRLKDLGDRLESAKEALEKPFDKEEELRAKSDRLIELDSLLSLDERVPEIAGGEPEEGADMEQMAQKSAVSEARAPYIQRNRGIQQDFVRQGGRNNAVFTARRAAVP